MSGAQVGCHGLLYAFSLTLYDSRMHPPHRWQLLYVSVDINLNLHILYVQGMLCAVAPGYECALNKVHVCSIGIGLALGWCAAGLLRVPEELKRHVIVAMGCGMICLIVCSLSLCSTKYGVFAAGLGPVCLTIKRMRKKANYNCS